MYTCKKMQNPMLLKTVHKTLENGDTTKVSSQPQAYVA